MSGPEPQRQDQEPDDFDPEYDDDAVPFDPFGDFDDLPVSRLRILPSVLKE